MKEDGGSGSGQEKVESSLSLKSMATGSAGTHQARSTAQRGAGYHGNAPAYYR